ncbi:MAG: sulfite exporter TauE/SafE family protein [Alphaproteobacteria bacterium]|nr:sulfite exporter TauE/SafE family protein [Alphaproteobacteria bacterium]
MNRVNKLPTNMLAFIGYSFPLAMGFILGLIGAGGSILTIPILVYFFNIKPIIATSYSLIIVGIAALVGGIRYWQHKQVNIHAAIIFAIPAMLTIFITRTYLVHYLPDPFLTIHTLTINNDLFIMLLFASLMILASIFMLKPHKIMLISTTKTTRYKKIIRFINLISCSSGIGFLSGLIGTGGGFLIIPTLIGIFKLNVKEAIGTSLTIIAFNSLIGFSGDLIVGIDLNWTLIAYFLSFTLLGIWIGTSMSKGIKAENLRKLFGYFTLVIAIYVITKELYTLL